MGETVDPIPAENADGSAMRLPAQARRIAVLFGGFGAVLTVLDVMVLVAGSPTIETPYVVGYLSAGAVGASATGVLAVARRPQLRWWLGVALVLAAITFIGTWGYVLLQSSQLWALRTGHDVLLPWVAGPLLGVLAGFLGVGVVRNREWKRPVLRRVRVERPLVGSRQWMRSISLVWVAVVWMVLTGAALVVAVLTRAADVGVMATFGLALSVSIGCYAAWQLQWRPRLRQWGLVASGAAMLGILAWWTWRGDIAALAWPWWLAAGAAAAYAVVAVVLGLTKADRQAPAATEADPADGTEAAGESTPPTWPVR